MFNYEKRLEYPVHITRTDPKAAMVIISQYGGPFSESLGVAQSPCFRGFVYFEIFSMEVFRKQSSVPASLSYTK